MVFAFPYAWLGIAALVGLAAVYVLRNRFRERQVSSLMLWLHVVRPREGGLTRDRLSLPPIFYLEAAALAALIVAAAAPYVRQPSAGTLTVVVDASASMSALGADGLTSQARAARALRAETARRNYARVRLIRAGAEGPEVAAAMTPAKAAAELSATPYSSCGDSLAQGMSRAGELSADGDAVLVLTDHAPPADLSDALRVRWVAVGKPQVNVAITHADRSCRSDGKDVLLVEVSGFGQPRGLARLTVSALGSPSVPLCEREVAWTEARPERVILELPPDSGAVAVALPDDALALDNHAVFYPQRPRPVAVDVRLADEGLRRVVRRAAEATGRVRFGEPQPQVVFLEDGAERAGAPYWQVALCRPQAPRLLQGPFLADSSSALLEGVSFEGLVWPVGTNALPGRGLVFAGDVPLIALDASARRMPVVRVVARSSQDPLFGSVAWPTFVWNVLAACSESLPGPLVLNVRVGESAVLALERGEEQATVETPSGAVVLRTRAGRVSWTPPGPGLYRMRMADPEAGRFAVNLFAPAESDLRGCAGGEWGGGRRTPVATLARTHRPYGWLAGLFALALIAAHHAVVCRKASGDVPS